MQLLTSLVLLGLTGCGSTPEVGCGEFDQLFVWADADGDGFGDEQVPIGWVCATSPGQSARSNDCDDSEPTTFPDAEEACDLVDNDCDGTVDEDSPKVPWYLDADHDGYGDVTAVTSACSAPSPDHVRLAGDCDDVVAAINPGAPEICNGGIDDDCDGDADDDDAGLDPTSTTRFYVDLDEDGYGDPETYRDRCVAGTRNPIVLNGDDCNDANAGISPLADEVCDRVDNDCDGLVDDFDPDIEPEGRREFYSDMDGDGYGDPNATSLACWPTPGVAVANDRDCDDTDPDANIPKAWVLDEDDDGVGTGQPTEYQCLRPGPHRAPYASGVDCAPLDPTVYPGAPDTCGDRRDTDCDGYDDCATCQQILSSTPTARSGPYDLSGPFGEVEVYCDMDTDGGGWTLVSSGIVPPDDAGGAWYADLATTSPVSGYATVWNGLRDFADGGVSDLRFTCKRNAADSTFAVDLSFYEVGWYTEITTGTDADSCFNENNGVGQDPPPARRDNIAQISLPAGDQWNYGYFEGEDSCTDTSDFTVDFDDRGMDSNQADGTDWGEDDGSRKCGTGTGASWFIFFRE